MSGSQEFDELLVACLSRLETDGDQALEAMCAEHPEQAALLRERVRLLRGAGLLSAPEGQPDFPERLGDFRLLSRLGQGGMGVVYLAEQESLDRSVALKLIRPEQLYFPGARQRFAREVEAVARLAHPGIVPVHLVGEQDGIPYFAMEYVRGASLESVLEMLAGKNPAVLTGHDLFTVVVAEVDHQPDSESTQGPPFHDSWATACLWIAREVAQALEHAHQRGVLHRDLKPSNVMLTPEGRVLLLDFGLASAEGSATLTGSGARVGSLAYMAPEQVDGRSDRIGRETDVYGLGVTLFELLAMRRPFEGASLTEVQRAILVGAAPKLRSVAPTSSPDMEAVVSKAISPEPERRYATAADFARDLTRLLEHRPVEARTAGPWLQLVRWTQRNRAAAVALGLALLIAIGGPLLFGYQQLLLTDRIQAEMERADQERDIADRERNEAQAQRAIADREREQAEELRALAERERGEAQTQRERAEKHLGQALEAVELMLQRVAERQLVDVPQMERVRRDLLTEARRFFTELEASSDGIPQVRWQAAGVGIALAHLERLLGDNEAASVSLSDQITVLRRLVDEQGEGRHRAGLALALARLARTEHDRGGPERALELTDEALSLLEEGLVRDVVDDKAWSETLQTRREALLSLGRGPEALRTADRLLEVSRRRVDRDPDDTDARRVLAVALAERGRIVMGHAPEETADYVARGRDVLRELLDADPDDGFVRLNFCEVSTMLSSALGLLDRHQQAYDATTEAVAVAASLVEDFPTARMFRRQLETLRVNNGVEALAIGRVEQAVEVLTLSVAGFEELVAADPGDANLHHSLGGALSNLSAVFLENDRHEEAAEPLERALAAHRTAVSRQPRNDFFRFHLGFTLLNRGLLAIEAGDWESVLQDFDEALPLIAFDPAGQRELAVQWVRGAQLIDDDTELEAPQRNGLVADYHSGALRALAAAAERDALDPVDLETNEVWDALRDYEEFEAVLAVVAGGP